MGNIIRQRLKRFNGSDYDSVYLSPNVGDAVGTLPVNNGGTGCTSVDAIKELLNISGDGGIKYATGSYKGTGSTTVSITNVGFAPWAFVMPGYEVMFKTTNASPKRMVWHGTVDTNSFQKFRDGFIVIKDLNLYRNDSLDSYSVYTIWENNAIRECTVNFSFGSDGVSWVGNNKATNMDRETWGSGGASSYYDYYYYWIAFG